MKKTATAFILLAGLGSGCVSTNSTKSTPSKAFNTAYKAKEAKNLVGITGEPIVQASAAIPAKSADVVQAGGYADPNVMQTAGFSRIHSGGGMGGSGGCSTCGDVNVSASGCNTCGGGGGVGAGIGGRFAGLGAGRLLGHKHGGGGAGGCNDGSCGGGGYGGGGGAYGHPGLPNGGPWGNMGANPYGPMAGLGGMGGMGAAMYPNQRTAVKFISPQGMQVSWWANGSFAEPGLSTPTAYNFAQGNIYRLRVRQIPNRPGKVYYPTIELFGATPKTITFLSHNTVPVGFTDEDFEQVNAGNLVVKVIYLPDAAYQELSTVAGAEELVSTKLQPGEDPIAEAQRRGTILAVIRLGNIDLENPNSPPMTGGPMGAMPQASAPMTAGLPGMMPNMMPNVGGSGGAVVGIPSTQPPALAKPATIALPAVPTAPKTTVTPGSPSAAPKTIPTSLPKGNVSNLGK